MPKIRLLLLFCFGIFLLCSNSYALTLTTVTDKFTGDELTLDSFTLDYMFEAGRYTPDTLVDTPIGSYRYEGKNLDGSTPSPEYEYGAKGVNLLTDSHVATGAIGDFDGNDDNDGSNGYDPNIGENAKGFMNDKDYFETNYDTPGAFITEAGLSDVDYDGEVDDPGWIYLSKWEAPNSGILEEYGQLEPYDDPSTAKDEGITIEISRLLSLTFVLDSNSTTVGRWELAADPTHIDLVRSVLGGSIFDHLAFVIKSGNANDGGFAIYDFDFNTILEAESEGTFNFETAYVLGGTFNAYDLGEKDISHITVLAHDPAPSAVPEPATMVFMGMGLLAIAGIGRKRQNRV